MSDWWEGSQQEFYWCEVTDRTDIGSDLKCPQRDEGGRAYWSYSLISAIRPGEVVFHYSTRSKAFVGASVAGAPLEERPIVWAPHGTVGRAKREARLAQPGWRLPLYAYRESPRPRTLKSLVDSPEREWVRDWIADKEEATKARLALPFQRYQDGLRGAQAYLTKMPADFVARWPELTNLANAVEPFRDQLAQLPAFEKPSLPFNPKNDRPYLVAIQATQQVRTRLHERIVRLTGEWLQSQGAEVTTPHPRDLLVSGPISAILEVKTTGARNPLFAIREAVGQLIEYRHFLGPEDALIGLVLDSAPQDYQVKYVEETLGMLLLWWSDDELHLGHGTEGRLKEIGLL